MITQPSSLPDCEAVCLRVAELKERVEELEEENQELKEKLALKEEKIKRLWGKLRRYDNPHTPPSKRLGPTKSKSESSKSRDKQEKLGNGELGRKKGHKGVTRPRPEPEETIVVEEKNYPCCGVELGESDKTETRVIEDIAEPQPIEVTEYKVNH